MRSSSLFVPMVLAVVASACQKSVSIDGKSVGSLKGQIGRSAASGVDDEAQDGPEGTIQVTGGLGGSRTHFQLRSVIDLVVSPELFAVDGLVTIRNLTSGALIFTGPRGTYLDVDIDDGRGSGGEPRLRIYPMTAGNAGKVAVGLNELEIVVESVPQRRSTVAFTIDNFRWLAMDSVHRIDDGKGSDGLELEASYLGNAVVTNGKHFLTVGTIPTLSR